MLSTLENEGGTAPMFVPCFGPELVDVDRWIVSKGRNDALLNVDVGRILPDPRPGIDTAALIRFPQKYDDERRRVMVAVERLAEQLSQTYSEPRHIERAVRRELFSALVEMRSAGRAVLRGWSRNSCGMFTTRAARRICVSPRMLFGARFAIFCRASVVVLGVRRASPHRMIRCRSELNVRC